MPLAIKEELDDPRADIAAAFDEIVERDEPEEDTDASIEEAGDNDAETEESAGEDSGAESPDEDESQSGDEDEAAGTKKKAEASGDNAEGEPADGKDNPADGRAPVSWDPAVREHWNKLPKEVKAQVEKREREVTQALGISTNARRFAEDFRSVVSPYEGIMRAAGANTPLEAVNTLLQTAAGLTIGSQTQKSQILANLIKQYDIDLPTLDSVLAGAMPSGADSDLDRMLNERLKPFQEIVNRDQQRTEQQQQSLRQGAATEIETFMGSKQAEFFEDVREPMADILDIAARNGKVMTIQQAYAKAVAMDPKLSEILAQRKRVKLARDKQGVLHKKKAASSSILGRASGTSSAGGESGHDDPRADILAAMEKHSGGRASRI